MRATIFVNMLIVSLAVSRVRGRVSCCPRRGADVGRIVGAPFEPRQRQSPTSLHTVTTITPRWSAPALDALGGEGKSVCLSSDGVSPGSSLGIVALLLVAGCAAGSSVGNSLLNDASGGGGAGA